MENEEPSEQKTLEIAVRESSPEGNYEASIGGSYIVVTADTEYEAVMRAIDALYSGVAGLAETRAHLKALDALRWEKAKELHRSRS